MPVITEGKTFRIKRFSDTGEFTYATGPYTVKKEFDLRIEYRNFLEESELTEIIEKQGFGTLIPTKAVQTNFVNWLARNGFIELPEDTGDVTFELYDGKLAVQ